MVADFTPNLGNSPNTHCFLHWQASSCHQEPLRHSEKHLIRVMDHGLPSHYFSKGKVENKKSFGKRGELGTTHRYGMLPDTV